MFVLFFRRHKFSHLIVVNGGYPGSYKCLAAILSWRIINPKRKAVLNVHNLEQANIRATQELNKGSEAANAINLLFT